MKVVFPTTTAALLLGAFSDAYGEKSSLRRRTQIALTSSGEDVIGDVSSLAALSSVQLSDFDTDADGELSIVEFINALQAAGISMTLEEVETLFLSLDTSGNTLIRIQDLESAVAATSTSTVSNADTIDDISSLAALSSVQLSDFDTDADGELSIVEFINALQAAGISMTLEEAEALFASLDTSGNTLVRIQDLESAVAATSTSTVSNADTIDDISSLAALSSVQLSDFDTDADGELAIVEFIAALEAAGITMTLEEAEALFASLDTSGNTLVRIQDLEAAIAANVDTIGDISSLAALSSVQLSDFDTDADGELAIVEFIAALEAAGITMTLEEAEALFASLDTSGNTLVRIHDLEAAIAANVDTIGDVSSIAALSTVQLSDFDTDVDGELAIVEFIAALEAAGITMTLEEVETLFASLDTSGNTLVRIHDLEAAIAANVDTIGDVSSIAALSTVQLSDFDIDADGELAIVEFIAALEAAGITMTLEEVETLFASLDTSGNTLVRIQDLESAVASAASSTLATAAPTVSVTTPISNTGTIGDVSSIAALSTVQLSDFDTDADGELAIVEFIAALEAAGITMTLEEVETLFASLDTSGNTLVRIHDLEAAIAANVDTIGDVSSIAALSTVQLSDFDIDADGELAIVEFIAALEAAGITMTLEEVETLFASLDTSGNTLVRIQDLESAVASAASSTLATAAPTVSVTTPISNTGTIGDVSSIAALSTVQLSDFDTDADGELAIVEFIAALEAAGITMTLEEVETLFASLDTSGNTLVRIQDLESAVGDLSTNIDPVADLTTSLQGIDISTFDLNSDGLIGPYELTLGLVNSGVSATTEEIFALRDSLDLNGDRFISIAELNGENIEESPTPINTVTNPISTVPTNTNVAEAISELDVPSFDINSDGEITAYEFTLGLINAGVTATPDSIYALMNSFDMNGNGRVGITEYQTSVVLESIQNLDLNAYDTDSNGKFNIVEFTSALVAGGVTNMPIEQLRGVFGMLDNDGDNFIPLSELEALVSDNSNIDLGNYSLCGDINLFQLGESLNSLMQSTPDFSSVEGAQALRDLLEAL